MKKIRGVLVDVNGEIKSYSLEYNDYSDIAQALNCNTVTYVRRVIGGVSVIVYCDEEALLKENQKPAIVSFVGNKLVEVLFGNCFICLHTKAGELKSLTHRLFEPVMMSSKNVLYKGQTYHCLSCTFQ